MRKVMMVVVVLLQLDLVRGRGAVNRLKILLHHLSLSWWQAGNAVLVGLTLQVVLMMIRAGTWLFLSGVLVSFWLIFSL